MLVLGIDTSTKVGSVALYSSETGLLGEVFINTNFTHSETIMDSIDNLFKLTKLNIKDVDRIAVSTGPGSFTGIRIGVGVGKGLAFNQKEIVGINELDLIASLAGNLTDKNYKIIPLIDARKERVYYSVYSQNQGGELVREEEYLDTEVLNIAEKYKEEKVIYLGDGAINYKKLLENNNKIFYSKALSLPRAGVLAEMSIGKNPDNIVTLEPFYISKTQAEREKNKGE